MERFFGIKSPAQGQQKKQQPAKPAEKKQQKKELLIADVYGKLKSFSPKAHSDRSKTVENANKLHMIGFHQHKWIDKIRRLQQQLDTLVSKYFIVENKNHQYLKRCKELKNLVQKLSQQNKKLRKGGGHHLSQFNLKQKYEEEKEASSKLTQEIRSLKSEYVARLKIQKEQCQKDIRDAKRYYEDLLEQQRKGLEKLRKDYGGHELTFKDYQNKLKIITSQNQRLKAAQRRNQEELNSYRRNGKIFHSKALDNNRSRSGDGWKSRNSNWNHQSKDYSEKYNRLNAQYEKLLTSEKILKNENANLKDQIRKLEMQKFQDGGQYGSGFILQKSLSLQKELLELQNFKRTSSNRKQRGLIEFCEQKQRRIIQLTHQVKDLDVQLRAYKQKINQNFSKLDFYSKENARLNQQLRRLNQQLRRLNERGSNNQPVLFSVQNQQKEYFRKSRNMQHLGSNRRLIAHNSNSNSNSKSRSRFENDEDTISRLKEQIWKLETQNNSLRRKIQEKQYENKNLTLEVRKLQILKKQREPPLPNRLNLENGRHNNISSTRNLFNGGF